MIIKSVSEKQLICQVKAYDSVIIYGAGMVGELLFSRLKSYGLQKKIWGFAVSKKNEESGKRQMFCNLPVYEISEIEHKTYTTDFLVIIATLPNLHEEIKHTLSKLQYKNQLFVSLKLYTELSQHYMHDYNQQHPVCFSETAKAKVVFMSSDNNKVSGAFLCMAELCEQLQKTDISVLVILPHYGAGASILDSKHIPYLYIEAKDWAYKVSENTCIWKKVRFIAGLILNIKAKYALIALFKNQRIDLVHCNTTYTYIGALAAKQCKIPYVWHLRENLEHQGYALFRTKQAWEFIAQAEKIIAVSHYIKKIIPIKKEEKVKVMYDAVEMKKKINLEREILQNKTVQMIQVGVLIQYKGQKELIEACYLLKKNYKIKFHLLIVGKGLPDYVDELRQCIKQYALEDEITFYGASNDVWSLYETSDISFMCSSKEAYGRVTIESQLSGCLVIGVDSGATTELIQDKTTGYLYKAGDVEMLAEKIRYAISTPEQSRKIAKEGQEYAKNTYTKEKNTQEVIKIYEEVLKRKV